MGSWSDQGKRKEAAIAYRLIRERGDPTFLTVFRQRFGPSCLDAWVRKAGSSARRSEPHDTDPYLRLLFALMEGIAYKWWDLDYEGRMVEGGNYPPLDEVKALMIEHRDEIRATNMIMPTYLGWLRGDYQFILG